MSQLGRVGAIRRPDDEDDICLFCEYLHRALAVGCRVADVSCLGQYDVRNLLYYSLDDASSVIDREGGLSEDDVLSSNLDPLYIFHTLDQGKVLTSLIDHPECFLMSSLTDIEDMVSLCDRITGFAVHLLDQWTGGIDPPHTETPQLCKITWSCSMC